MSERRSTILFGFLLLLILSFSRVHAAEPMSIAVLDFELRDMTLAPGIPAEVARTASIKPLLKQELTKLGYRIIEIPAAAQQRDNAGVGYLFDHGDSAAQLAKQFDVDYVVVGRLHKPSFLFVYLMAHLIDVRENRMVGDYISEVKGGEKKLTQKGVESLAVKIERTLSTLP